GTKGPVHWFGWFTANVTRFAPSRAFPVAMNPSTRQYSGTEPVAGFHVADVRVGSISFAKSAPWSAWPCWPAAWSRIASRAVVRAAQSWNIGTWSRALAGEETQRANVGRKRPKR